MSIFHGPLIRFGFRHLLRAKKTWAAVAVSLIPLLAGILLIFADINNAKFDVRDQYYNADLTDWIAFFAIGGTVPLVALLLAGGSLADESQDRTLTYLLTRPIPRSTLYVSKFVPVATAVAVLAAAQVLMFGLMRMLALAVTDPGARALTYDDSSTVAAGGLLALMTFVGTVAAVLAGVAYSAIFAFVSLLFQRFHFLVNLLIYLVWELPFGTIGGAGFGFFTVLFHAQSFVSKADPTINGFHDSSVHPAFAAVWLTLAVVGWVWLGAWRTRRQDFHVTSAST